MNVAKPTDSETSDSADAPASETETRLDRALAKHAEELKQSALAAVRNGASLEEVRLRIFEAMSLFQELLVERMARVDAVAEPEPTNTSKPKPKPKRRKR